MNDPLDNSNPLKVEVHLGLDPFQAARRLERLPDLLLMESSMQHPELGRYSFLMADPVDRFQPNSCHAHKVFHWLDHRLQNFKFSNIELEPPFRGGIAGLFNYEFNSAVEEIEVRDKTNPVVSLCLFDVVLVWDHFENTCMLYSSGIHKSDTLSDSDLLQERGQARERANHFLNLLQTTANKKESAGMQSDSSYPSSTTNLLTSNFDRQSYQATIQTALDYIHEGDIFQVNIAQQLSHPAIAPAIDLYQKIRVHNPSPFACYFDLGNTQVISASPERLVSVKQGKVETRPIKGTRPRTRHPEVDIDVSNQLLASEKDRAENVMIVDLMRNDLSRICTDDSVKVSQFVGLEHYASVIHLVSAIEGKLLAGTTASEILSAVFPGGSITGAPKVRAMEIIGELEPDTRGPYCGSIGYFGFDGNIDLNILIRTVTATNERWLVPVGGGIVADSDPALEYEETWTKAHGMLKSISAVDAGTVGDKK